MNIALIGYGKMGKAIEALAMERGHEIVLKIDENNLSDFNKENIAKADVAERVAYSPKIGSDRSRPATGGVACGSRSIHGGLRAWCLFDVEVCSGRQSTHSRRITAHRWLSCDRV